MTHASAAHRALDAAHAEALARDRRRELAQDGWITRRLVELGGKLVAVWSIVEQDRDRDRMVAE